MTAPTARTVSMSGSTTIKKKLENGTLGGRRCWGWGLFGLQGEDDQLRPGVPRRGFLQEAGAVVLGGHIIGAGSRAMCVAMRPEYPLAHRPPSSTFGGFLLPIDRFILDSLVSGVDSSEHSAVGHNPECQKGHWMKRNEKRGTWYSRVLEEAGNNGTERSHNSEFFHR